MQFADAAVIIRTITSAHGSLMRLQAPLLLLLCFMVVFTPTLNHWIYSGGQAWYRLHLLWLAVIVFVFLANYRRKRDV